MNVTLYKYLAERNKVDKSGDLVFVASCTGAFKADVNILSPALLLTLPPQGALALTDENGDLIGDICLVDGVHDEVLDFNYMYIAEFRRYYYVNSIVVSSQSLLTVVGEVDPLYSFKDELLSNVALIARNEFEYDVELADEELPLYLEKEVTEYKPPLGTFATFEFDTNVENQYPCVTITTIGGRAPSSLITPPNSSGLPEINPFPIQNAVTTYAITYETYEMIINGLCEIYSDWRDTILSVVAYPFRVADGDTLSNIKFGKDEDFNYRYMQNRIAGGSAYIQGEKMPLFSQYLCIADFLFTGADTFLDIEPYSQYELYVPFLGFYKLDYSTCANHRILVYYSINLVDGSSTVYIYDYTAKRLLHSSPCQIGMKLALASTNQHELDVQKNAINLNLAVGLISSALSVGAGVAGASPASIVGGAMRGASAIASAVNQYSMLFPRASASYGDGATALYSPLDVRLRVTKTKTTITDFADYRHLHGSPLRDVRRLSDLRGFTKVATIHIENCGATETEKAEMQSSLLAGVIL